MRAVNLLPEGDRPAAPAEPVKGGAYAVLGVLGALVIATFTYVTATNQITTRTDDIAQARTEIEAANARAGALGPFQQFAQITRRPASRRSSSSPSSASTGSASCARPRSSCPRAPP